MADDEFAVGHIISLAPRGDSSGHCHQISTTWLPQATVERVLPRVEELEAGGLVLSMAELDRLASKQQQATATELLQEASKQARLAFAITNRVMDAAARQRFGVMRGRKPADVQPRWRPFQLAFLLMNLVGMEEPTDADRDTVKRLRFGSSGDTKTEGRWDRRVAGKEILHGLLCRLFRVYRGGEQSAKDFRFSVVIKAYHNGGGRFRRLHNKDLIHRRASHEIQ